MARRCAVCGKEASTGYTVSHSHHKTKRRFAPNLQRVRALIGGTRRRVRVCTACIKGGKVTRVARPALTSPPVPPS
jgi:large subunit ribosomal protein L28